MNEPRTWVTSDTHFGHAAIIDLDAYGHCIHRPFRDVDDMDRQLIERWNARVGKGDTIFHLGDIAWNEDALMRVCAELNGVKKLILGNHDTLEAGVYWETGFEVVNGNYSCRAGDNEYVMLSHAPVHESCLTMPGVAIPGEHPRARARKAGADGAPRQRQCRADRVRADPGRGRDRNTARAVTPASAGSAADLNEAAGIPRGRLPSRAERAAHVRVASMRPRVFPAEDFPGPVPAARPVAASMRPRVFPAEDLLRNRSIRRSIQGCFNEAAGIPRGRPGRMSSCASTWIWLQ